MSQGFRQGGAPSRVPQGYTTRAMEMCAPPAKPLPRIVIQDWVPIERNTLRGFFTVIDNETGILLHECSLHIGADNDWIGLPCSPKIYDNQVVRRNGRVEYRSLVKIVPRERYESFVAAVIEALRAHPEAGRCWEGGR